MGQNSLKIPIIPLIGLNFFMGTQETIISISVNKSRFGALFAIFDILGPKKGPQNPTKKLTHLVYLEIIFLTFLTLDPPPPPPPALVEINAIKFKVFY